MSECLGNKLAFTRAGAGQKRFMIEKSAGGISLTVFAKELNLWLTNGIILSRASWCVLQGLPYSSAATVS